MPLNAEQILAVARLRAIKLLPDFSEAVYGLVFVPKPGLGTMGVSARGVCMYDPETIMDWGTEHTAGVILHEIGHVLRRHHKRAKALNVAPTPENLRAVNVCEDAEIDDDLIPAKIPHPSSHPLIDPTTLPHKNAARGEAHATGALFETYWANLPRDENDTPDAGSIAKPACGGCAGNPLPGEAPDGAVDGKGRSDVEMERIRRKVASNIQHRAQIAAGSVSASWVVWANETLAPPTIPWQDKFAALVGSACNIVAGNVDHRYDRPSRRQWGIGFGEGFPIFPRMVSPIPRITVAIDTSGSMFTGGALQAAVSEVQGILDTLGAPVKLIACDCVVHTQVEIETIKDVVAALSGGGGTSFVPVFDAIAASNDPPDILVFVTDGCGAAPVHAPDYPVIWVEVGTHAQLPMTEAGHPISWGEHVTVPPQKI
jgi:hypothetical protein